MPGFISGDDSLICIRGYAETGYYGWTYFERLRKSHPSHSLQDWLIGQIGICKYFIQEEISWPPHFSIFVLNPKFQPKIITKGGAKKQREIRYELPPHLNTTRPIRRQQFYDLAFWLIASELNLVKFAAQTKLKSSLGGIHRVSNVPYQQERRDGLLSLRTIYFF